MGHSVTPAPYSLTLYFPASPTQCNYRTHPLMYVVLLAVKHLEVIPERHIRTNMLHIPPSLRPQSQQGHHWHHLLSVLLSRSSVQSCVQSPVRPATNCHAYPVVQRIGVTAQTTTSIKTLRLGVNNKVRRSRCQSESKLPSHRARRLAAD